MMYIYDHSEILKAKLMLGDVEDFIAGIVDMRPERDAAKKDALRNIRFVLATLTGEEVAD